MRGGCHAVRGGAGLHPPRLRLVVLMLLGLALVGEEEQRELQQCSCSNFNSVPAVQQHASIIRRFQFKTKYVALTLSMQQHAHAFVCA